MALEINSSTANTLPSSVRNSLAKMSPEDQSVFEEEYKKKMKSSGLMFALALLFPIHYFLLGKTGLGIAFLLTAGGAGFWYMADLFRIWGMVRSHNEDAAKTQLRDMKIMAS